MDRLHLSLIILEWMMCCYNNRSGVDWEWALMMILYLMGFDNRGDMVAPVTGHVKHLVITDL